MVKPWPVSHWKTLYSRELLAVNHTIDSGLTICSIWTIGDDYICEVICEDLVDRFHTQRIIEIQSGSEEWPCTEFLIGRLVRGGKVLRS